MNLASIFYYYNSNDYYKAIEAHKRTIEIANRNNGLILINKLCIIKCYLNLCMNNDAFELIKDFISVYNHQLLDKIFEESGIKGVINWFIALLEKMELENSVNQ